MIVPCAHVQHGLPLHGRWKALLNSVGFINEKVLKFFGLSTVMTHCFRLLFVLKFVGLFVSLVFCEFVYFLYTWCVLYLLVLLYCNLLLYFIVFPVFRLFRKIAEGDY